MPLMNTEVEHDMKAVCSCYSLFTDEEAGTMDCMGWTSPKPINVKDLVDQCKMDSSGNHKAMLLCYE